MEDLEVSCPVCRGTQFTSGQVTMTGATNMQFREKTSWITSNWTKMSAKMCNSCGYVMMFGEIGPGAVA